MYLIILWRKIIMDLILGMDPVVFIAWIGTIFSAILCVLFGIYYEYFKKSRNEKIPIVKNHKSEKKEVE
jgi:ABC-type dipeptide/oligopeptide/nickel transport system permease subunit